ncbi:MAG: right-handed parallel beta-helix repeat-containing protein [Verrucomicrobia bacterium]|nr:right-handed parallel beta-helix repeat-containing protein [Verrucomicrobiota bacterium]MBT7066226.1 right-handed parallel beta-helix repeat-containing protein [Verrucomicrobiota bacterium]MBT7699703.1 right-handed parallel beta-helix repeat-containing protein [Verrucomicrobiota bacterium]
MTRHSCERAILVKARMTVCEQDNIGAWPNGCTASPGDTTYFIDPASGCDERCGTERAEAWCTFAPLNRLCLAPGDRVEVVSPGSFNQSLALTGSGTAASPIRVHFAPGRYDIYPANAHRRRYNISNCNDDADHDKAIGILIENAAHLSITGPGARIVFRGKMIEVCIDQSETITVSDLDFDYHRPTVSEFTVTAATETHADLAVHKDSLYSIKDGQLLWQGEGWTYETGLAQELIPETEEVWRRPDPLVGLRMEEIAPFRLRAHGAHDMVAGRVFQLRDTFRDCVGVFVRRSRGVTFSKINFYFLHGMGVLCQFSQDITLEAVRIAPEEGSGRTSAAWADCTHFSGCGGRIVMKDCLLCGAHDDAVNVHGTHLRIVEQVSDDQIRVRFMHRQTYGFMAFNPGDEIEFVRWDSLAPFASNRVSDAALTDPRELLLTLEQPVPTDWHADDVIENTTWAPEVEISGCTAVRIPTRGFLLTTRRRTVVSDNSFVRLRIGIHVESDAEGWFESGSVRDMTIRGNRFLDCKRTAVCVSPHFSKPNDSVHRNIRITDNEMVVPEKGSAIEVSGTTGLTVTGNRIRAALTGDHATMFQVTGCADVQIEDNRLKG